MNKPVGGRGVKAPYETTHVRVPLPIKADIERLIDQFKVGSKAEAGNSLTGIDEAVVIAKSILINKKSARVSMQKLLTALYGQNVEL
jgi:hypothetical protein